ncbi:MAG: lecithin retinol acyltransferase family protein [Bacteroidetes bacterium]|nr:lecithin retinol acyltransferase family protein [Bacteroidota bacterium]
MRLIEKDLNPGDHVYVKRRGLLYSHHGIYAGNGNVIHYTGAEKEKKDPSVTNTDIEEFLKDGKLRRRDYKKRLPYSETLNLAKRPLSDNGYSLTFNNCEHFATYCATGKKKSKQVQKAIGVLAGVTLTLTGAIIRKKIVRK